MKTYVFHPDRCVPPSTPFSRHSFDGTVLVAGLNRLSDEAVKPLEEHPDFKRYLDWKAIEPLETESSQPDEQSTEIENLSAYSLENSQTIIQQTDDVETLKKWLATESRQKVRQSLNARIATVQKGEE